MSRIFTKTPLFKEGTNFPPSLPLVLPSNYSFDFETQKITEIVKPCSDTDFKLIPDALQLLENITKPIAVASICGPYRTGKSYFVSRMLGNSETFKLGHTQRAETRGIWMASSVLECDEFALLILDTEGIDAAEKSSSRVTRLLVLTMLLSSMFVYNSINVPRGSDLRKMSCLANVSKMVEGEANDQNIPDFLWLLRDVDSIPTNSSGNTLSPADFLKQVLQKNRSCSACSTLLQYFPSLHCLTIPPPSTDAAILSEITSNLENLSVKFNESLNDAIQYMLEHIRIKLIGYDSSLTCNGRMLACLIEQHFKFINESGSTIPTFQMSWLMAIELRLRRLSESLVCEYDREMKVKLEGRFPMTEGQHGETGVTLMNTHLEVFAKKRLQLQKEIVSLLSHSFNEKLSSLEISLIAEFDDSIAEFDRATIPNKVISGQLFHFIQDNIRLSEEFCCRLYIDKYNQIVHIKLQNSLLTQMPATIDEELHLFEKQYFDEAIGPAVYYTYEQMRAESLEVEANLKLIPGPVEEFNVVGVDADRVKLRWKSPEINASAVELYDILIKSKGKEWEVVATRKGCSVLVTGLQCSTWYCLSARARSSRFCGNKVQFVQVRTLMSKLVQNAIHAGAVGIPAVMYPCMVAYAATGYISRGIQSKSVLDVVGGGFMLTMLPATAVIGMIPVAGMFASSDTYQKEITDRLGDLSQSDTEVLQWANTPTVPSKEVDVPSFTVPSKEVDVPDDSAEDLCDEAASCGVFQDLEESSDES